MYDILIQNGKIVDGSGAPAFYGDIAVKDGKIVSIAPHITGEAAQVIDATGLVVSPGFIDCHTHSDGAVFNGSSGYNYLEQGVTTQVAGNCGSHSAPYYPGAMRGAQLTMKPEAFARRAQIAESYATFMEHAASVSIGTNMAFFAGHSPIRGKVMGRTDAAPTADQMEQMKDLLTQAMEQGYLGYSTGLVYAPSVYASTEELIELTKAMTPYGGIYASHIRGEGDYVERSVQEAIRIGEEAGVPVHISHLKVMGAHNEGKSEALLRLIEDANARGVQVTADQYAYTASSASLSSQIPPKYLVGGPTQWLERIQSPQIRAQIEHDMFHAQEEFESGIYHAGWDGTYPTILRLTPQYQNRAIGQIAREEGKAPIDVLCDLLLANNGESSGIYFNQNPSDLFKILSHPQVFGGSDSSDVLGARKDSRTEGGRHPRGFGNMVRRLELIRDFRLRSLEDSIRSITSAPAQALGLFEQGLLAEGRDANITVFNYETLHALASYEYPYMGNNGIEYVLVNGAVAVSQGKTTGTCAGKILKRSK